jgi:uncharacterized protein
LACSSAAEQAELPEQTCLAAMSDSAAQQPRAHPVARRAPRGGVLGMLAVHIQWFAYPMLARLNPTAYGDLKAGTGVRGSRPDVLADGKFIAIFAMLLGVSVVMLPGGTAVPAWRTHMIRMAALLALGLRHAYVFWYGDMLVPLACAARWFTLLAALSPRRLLVLGGLVFAAGSVLTLRPHVEHGPRPVRRTGGMARSTTRRGS